MTNKKDDLLRRELFSSKGYYNSCYLKMVVDSPSDFSELNENLSDSDSALFFHEYVHYLQDITTTFGFMNIVNEVDHIKLINQKIINSKSDAFPVPYKLKKEDGDIFTNLENSKTLVGGGAKNNINNFKIVIQSIKKKDIEDIEGVFLFNDTHKIKYLFGSYCICETMAYELEQILYRDQLPSPPNMPYNSGKIVVNLIYPELLNDPLNVIALCDASLMYSHPGMVYYKILKSMHSESYSPKNPEEIYDYVKKKIPVNQNGVSNTEDLFTFWGENAKKQFMDYFTTDTLIENHNWIKRTIEGAIELRIKCPTFILDLARLGDIRTNILFKAIIKKIGLPLIVNKKDEVFFAFNSHSEIKNLDPSYFWVFNEIKKLTTEDLRNTGFQCGLKNYCRKTCKDKGIEDFVDYECQTAPWNRSNDTYKNLCSFGVIWKTWELKGKSLTTIEE